MLTSKPVNAGAGKAKYEKYVDTGSQLERFVDDKGDHGVGHWYGQFANALGLNGRIKRGQVKSFLEGYHPLNRSDWVAKNAGNGHKGGWDLTFSPPKSVSVIWAISSPVIRRQIETAQNSAVKAALSYLVAQAAFVTRSRRNAEKAQIASAIFQHGLSRALDCQLHTHAVVFNATTGPNGPICAIDFDTRWEMPGGAFYRAVLASKCKELGFPVEIVDHGFRISSVPVQLDKHFSKRRSDIEQDIAKGAPRTDRNMNSTLRTRRKKVKDIVFAEHSARWRVDAAKFGITSEAIEKMLTPQSPCRDPIPLPGVLVNQLTELVSTVSIHQLHVEVCNQAIGKLDGVGIRDYIKSLLSDPEIVKFLAPSTKDRKRFATMELRVSSRQMVDVELAISRMATSMSKDISWHELLGSMNPDRSVVESHELEAAFDLTRPNKLAIFTTSDKPDMPHTFLDFLPTYRQYRDKLVEYHSDFLGDNWRKMRLRSEKSKLTKDALVAASIDISNKIAFIPDASRFGSRRLYQLMKSVEKTSAKIVMTYRTMDVETIDCGGGLRAASRGVAAGWSEQYRSGISRSHSKQVIPMEESDVGIKSRRLFETKRATVCAGVLRVHDMVERWLTTWDEGDPTKSLMIGGSADEILALNVRARKKLRPNTQLLAIDTASGKREIGVGDRIVFTKANRKLPVKKGMFSTIKSLTKNDFGFIDIVALADNKEILKFSSSECKDFDLAYATTYTMASYSKAKISFVSMDSAANREFNYLSSIDPTDEVYVFMAPSLAAELGIPNRHTMLEIERVPLAKAKLPRKIPSREKIVLEVPSESLPSIDPAEEANVHVPPALVLEVEIASRHTMRETERVSMAKPKLSTQASQHEEVAPEISNEDLTVVETDSGGG